MLDENLPSMLLPLLPLERFFCTLKYTELTITAFYLKANQQQKHLWTVYLCHHGNEPYPTYILRYPDPASPSSSKNRYAVALCDPYVPDIIYGEILINPEWTQPSLSADAIRQNGGETPPPEPLLPSKFTVHLYNPDQEIVVRYKPKTWNSPAAWDFEMPQHTFRQPSTSTLDRTQLDPATADVTPKLRFGWRRDSKLSKDLVCLLFGKTAMIPDTSNAKSSSKNKNNNGMKEPGITISIFKALREMTLYEPNLYRVEMEDFKGLEVVLFLGAVAIRDVWFGGLKEAFRVDYAALQSQSTQKKKPTQKPAAAAATTAAASTPALVTPPAAPMANNPSPTASGAINSSRPQQKSPPGPGPTPAQRPEGRPQKKQSGVDEKTRRKKEAEVEKETKRLQKIYGKEEEQARRQRRASHPPNPSQPPRPAVQRPAQQPHPYAYPHSYPQGSAPHRPPHPAQQRPSQSPSRPHLPPRPAAPATMSTPYLVPGPGPYGYGPAPGYAPGNNRLSSMQFLPQPSRPRPSPGAGPGVNGNGAAPLQPKKSSFFGFVRRSSDDKDKLHKKRSSIF